MGKEKFTGGQWRITVVGLHLIFAVLCLITKIMIYQLTLKYNIDNDHINMMKEELDEIKRSS